MSSFRKVCFEIVKIIFQREELELNFIGFSEEFSYLLQKAHKLKISGSIDMTNFAQIEKKFQISFKFLDLLLKFWSIAHSSKLKDVAK